MVAILFSKQEKIITLRQTFLAIYVLCKSNEASCNNLSFRTLMIFKQSAVVAMLFSKRGTKFFYRHVITATTFSANLVDNFVNE